VASSASLSILYPKADAAPLTSCLISGNATFIISRLFLQNQPRSYHLFLMPLLLIKCFSTFITVIACFIGRFSIWLPSSNNLIVPSIKAEPPFLNTCPPITGTKIAALERLLSTQFAGEPSACLPFFNPVRYPGT
jgi:hypothetical protein